MQFTVDMPGVRMFYLGIDVGTPTVQRSKKGGAFAPAVNSLIHVGMGWWSLSLTPLDTDTLGPLAWSIGTPAVSQPDDQVVPLSSGGDVDPVAITAALNDLAHGFSPEQTLQQMLQRPVFNFLQSLF
jgi:hypothetical protein